VALVDGHCVRDTVADLEQVEVLPKNDAADETLPVVAAEAAGQEGPGKMFGGLVLVTQVVLLVLYWIAVEPEWAAVCSSRNASEFCADGGVMAEERYYKIYLDIALMMLVGFGYLMTFLQFYGLGAVGFTMLITALGVQWSIM
jgi:hypothetical protein